jgi:hypothetical protein
MSQLMITEFGVWAKIFGVNGLKLGWLSKRSGDETLIVRELKTRYFNPTPQYMADVLASPTVAAHIKVTRKKKPIYVITGIKWVEGVSVSKTKEKATNVSGEGSGTDPHSLTQVGGKASFTSEDKTAASFKESTDFIVGFRVRKIFWKRGGGMETSDKVAGSVLDGTDEAAIPAVLVGVQSVDDFLIDDIAAADTREKVYVDEEGHKGIEASVWVFP